MSYAFIAEKQVAFPVTTLCRVLAVSRSGFYDDKERANVCAVGDVAGAVEEVATLFEAVADKRG